MSLSRVESRKQQQRQDRSSRKKRRRSGIITVCLSALLLIGLAIVFQYDRVTDMYESISAKLNGDEQPIYNVENSQLGDNSSKQELDQDAESGQTSADDQVQEEALEQEIETGTSGNGNEGVGLSGSSGAEDDEKLVVPSSEPDSNATIQLAFVGDILQGEYINGYLQQEGYSYPFEEALFHLTSADITAGNLEMPITTRDNPADKTYVFKGKPEALSGLVDAGIDIVSLANNHTLDHGVDGMLDTRKYLDEYGIAHVGAGNNAEEAYASVIMEANGIKVAYVGTSKVLPEVSWKATPYQAGLAESYQPEQTLQAIEKVEEEAHITVVLVHWGEERKDHPNSDQLALAKKYVDAGADIVIGSHPHVLQGFEQYNGKWIAYSLGNFVFAAHPKGRQAETGVLTATCNAQAECEAQFAPMKIVNAQPTPVEGEVSKQLLEFLEMISRDVELDDRGNLTSIH